MEGLGPGLVGNRRYGKQPVKGGREGFRDGEAGGRLRFWRGAGGGVQRAGLRVEWRGQGREDVTGSEGPGAGWGTRGGEGGGWGGVG